ncbi:uncharacterized protein N7498_009942 [Penicillium cinerascens]|uniref:DUF7702 domain-containing protein n=1 Tax=Penicillium cinerascens TaxID=70096 RepID=A0A9W9M8F8_9EURO|nr:uncharacterized protein N7498_009942 [Penicillium cinerascens]KAJ5190957.1 hypothetical protein N7498_009942 [Penicillium cinerascens]
MNDRSKVSIALICFYLPAEILAAILLFHRHGRPRMAWIYLAVFSISMDLPSKISVLVLIMPSPNRLRIGLAIASLILLDAGFFPLVNATVGLLRIIAANDMKDDPKAKRGYIISRILFIAGIVLIVAGGSLSVSQPKTALTLTKIGYIIMLLFVAWLIVCQVYFSRSHDSLSAPSIKILQGTITAIPFLIVRVTYLLLSVFHPDHNKWSALFGDIDAWIVMVLVMEYIVVWLYIGTGYRIPATNSQGGF